MTRFIYHEPLAVGHFNAGHTTGTGPFSAWQKSLCNNESLLDMLVRRLDADWTSLSQRMRKPWGAREVDAWLQERVELDRAGNASAVLRRLSGMRGAVQEPGFDGVRGEDPS